MSIVKIYRWTTEFFKEQNGMRAAALTYYTVMSIVPVLAIAFGIASGFGFKHDFETQLLQQFPEQQPIVAQVIEFAEKALERAKGGVIAGAGFTLLLWSGFSLLRTMEISMNSTWKLVKPRNLIRCLTDYLTILIIAPICLVIANSLVLFAFGWISGVIPIMVNTLLFTFLYMVMPNRSVPLCSALFSAFLAAFTFQIIQWGYLHFQARVSTYSVIYGSFAAIPLFFLWVHISWLVILGGVKINKRLSS